MFSLLNANPARCLRCVSVSMFIIKLACLFQFVAEFGAFVCCCGMHSVRSRVCLQLHRCFAAYLKFSLCADTVAYKCPNKTIGTTQLLVEFHV